MFCRQGGILSREEMRFLECFLAFSREPQHDMDADQRQQALLEEIQTLLAARLAAHVCKMPAKRMAEILLPDLSVWLARQAKKASA